MWSIGNEILEQWDSNGTNIAGELAGIVGEPDTTPVHYLSYQRPGTAK